MTAATSEADAAAGRTRTETINETVAPLTNGTAALPPTAATSTATTMVTQPAAAPKITKRQRRAAKNDKHAWPQHPKIQNAEQRERAYLRVAGLVPSSDPHATTSSSSKTLLPPRETEAQEQQPHADMSSNFAKRLGSADARTRHQTVLQLRRYLEARCNSSKSDSGISELELLKLWKCLWYTLYMADKVPVQAELSKHISSLIWSLQGTPEEDAYAAAAYLQLQEEEEEENEHSDKLDENEDDDDDDEVVMEEIENTLQSHPDDDDEDDEISVASSEIDFEQKQLALLEEVDEESDEHSETESDEDDDEMEVAAGEADMQEDSEDFNEDEEQDCEQNDAEIGHCRGAHLAALFVRTFFRTIVREWGRMDKYRIDKFYTLIREMMNVVFTYMAQRHWSVGLIRLFNDAIYDECLSQTPNGVRYHVIDVCLDELCQAASKAGLPLTEATLVDVLEPYFAMAQTGCGGDDTIHSRVTEHILEKFLTQCSVYSPASVLYRQSQSDQAPTGILDQVHVGTIAQFIFDVAADEAVLRDEYRKSLYAVHKSYVRRMHEIGMEHDIEIHADCSDEQCTDEVCTSMACKVHDIDEPEKENESDTVEQEPVVRTSESVKHSAKVRSTLPKPAQNQNATSTEDKSARVGTAEKSGAPAMSAHETDSARKKRKRKKKSKDSEDLPAAEPPGASAEEEITITVAQQRDARERKTPTVNGSEGRQTAASKERPISATQSSQEVEQERKRVKFGNVNKARSWKASIQGLQNLETLPLNASPEKSILLNKDAKIVINTNAHVRSERRSVMQNKGPKILERSYNPERRNDGGGRKKAKFYRR
jgi:hypothetical protein